MYKNKFQMKIYFCFDLKIFLLPNHRDLKKGQNIRSTNCVLRIFSAIFVSQKMLHILIKIVR
jgi:hypothetical protein